MEDYESLENGLKQRVKEELGLQIKIDQHLTSVFRAYTHFRITLHTYAGHLSRGTPKALTCQDWQWIAPADFQMLPSSKIDRMIMQAILYDK